MEKGEKDKLKKINAFIGPAFQIAATNSSADTSTPGPTSTTAKSFAPCFGQKPLAETNGSTADQRPGFTQSLVFPFSAQPVSPWRNVEWTEDRKKTLMKAVGSYQPKTEESVTQARVLLLGPVSSGKSSFISSIQSVFNGRVTNRAMVGSFTAGFTKKLQSFSIRGQNGVPTGLVLCDGMGLGDGFMTGLTLHDALSVIKGHVPEGHKFNPDQPVHSEMEGFVKKPGLKDQIHCVAFVVDASKNYSSSFNSAFRQLRKHISDMGVHQVALLTHIDKICPKTAKDVTQVYTSQTVKEAMDKTAVLLGMSTSYIVPVKNYSSELEVDVNTDILLLSAIDHILQYTDLFFQDNSPSDTYVTKYKPDT